MPSVKASSETSSPLQAFFDDHLVARRRRTRRSTSMIARRPAAASACVSGQEHAFARRQPGGFDHDRIIDLIADSARRLRKSVKAAKRAVGMAWRAMKCFGERPWRLRSGRRPGEGPKTGMPGRAQRIGQTRPPEALPGR